MGLLATPLCDGTDSELDAESNGHPDMIKDLNSIYHCLIMRIVSTNSAFKALQQVATVTLQNQSEE